MHFFVCWLDLGSIVLPDGLFQFIAEFDALTGSKISALDIGAPAVRMSYSPTSGHTVIAILQVDHTWTFHVPFSSPHPKIILLLYFNFSRHFSIMKDVVLQMIVVWSENINFSRWTQMSGRFFCSFGTGSNMQIKSRGMYCRWCRQTTI